MKTNMVSLFMEGARSMKAPNVILSTRVFVPEVSFKVRT